MITSILAQEAEATGTISFRKFYLRRALRLTPALWIVCLFQIARSWHSSDPHSVQMSALIGLLYLENWNVIFHWADSDMLATTWSLAVEEQFYLLWPAMLMLIFWRKPQAWLAAALIISLGLRWSLIGVDPYILQHTFLRPCGLIIGCLLALAPKDMFKPRDWAVPALLAAIGGLALFTNERDPLFLAFVPLVTSLIAAALIVCASPNGILSLSPLRYIGKVSYGLYLYHYPILIIGQSPRMPHLPTPVLMVIAFGVASLSYEFVERPFLRLKDRFQTSSDAVDAVLPRRLSKMAG